MILLFVFYSKNTLIFWNVSISHTCAMSNRHLWLIVHVNSHCVVHSILFCDWLSDQFLLSVDYGNLWSYSFVKLLLLHTKAINPSIFRLLIIGNNIEISCSQILLSKFKTSFNLNLFHATIISLPLDIGCWHINSFVGVKIGAWVVDHMLLLPFVTYVDYGLWLRVEQACVSLEIRWTNWNLIWCSKTNFYIWK